MALESKGKYVVMALFVAAAASAALAAPYVHAQSQQNSPSQAVQKDNDPETNDDNSSADNHQDGETNDDNGTDQGE